MSYVVTIYGITPGTTSLRKTGEVRRTAFAKAVDLALAFAEKPNSEITVSRTSRDGRTLLGSVKGGDWNPTEAGCEEMAKAWEASA